MADIAVSGDNRLPSESETIKKLLPTLFPGKTLDQLTRSEQKQLENAVCEENLNWFRSQNGGQGTEATNEIDKSLGKSSSSTTTTSSSSASLGGSIVTIDGSTYQVIDIVDLTEENLIPEHATETGFDVADHIVVKPKHLKITLKLPKSSTSGSIPGGAADINYSSVESIRTTFGKHALMLIQTPMATLTNMAFVNLALRDSTESDNFTFAETEFVEIRMATTNITKAASSLVGISSSGDNENENIDRTVEPPTSTDPKQSGGSLEPFAKIVTDGVNIISNNLPLIVPLAVTPPQVIAAMGIVTSRLLINRIFPSTGGD